MRSVCRLPLALAFAAAVPLMAWSDPVQGRASSTSGLITRVRTTATTEPASAPPGGTLTLRLEIRPDRNVRVFALGADDFTPVVLAIARPKQVKIGLPIYSIPDVQKNPGNKKKVPLYTGTFRIDHRVTLDEKIKPGSTIEVMGMLTYQACDGRMVFPTRTVPVKWLVRVAEPAE